MNNPIGNIHARLRIWKFEWESADFSIFGAVVQVSLPHTGCYNRKSTLERTIAKERKRKGQADALKSGSVGRNQQARLLASRRGLLMSARPAALESTGAGKKNKSWQFKLMLHVNIGGAAITGSNVSLACRRSQVESLASPAKRSR